MEVTNSDPEKSARRALLVAAGASVLGVAIAGTVSRTAGGVFLVLGWLDVRVRAALVRTSGVGLGAPERRLELAA